MNETTPDQLIKIIAKNIRKSGFSAKVTGKFITVGHKIDDFTKNDVWEAAYGAYWPNKAQWNGEELVINLTRWAL